ncbi:MAG: gliding motility-associated C-terminal domain-containing protein [Prevotellaceae bacterium]|jgi:gliding motility-associated-like protein|nr:gliding motility-associated C-terminal domain-containing protein [Prevotellaceae bacterium]
MKHKLTLLAIVATITLAANAQCPDFMNINAANVQAFTGNTSNPFMTPGVVNGRHTLISTQGTDPNTGNALSLLPPGETSVVKLGNQNVGGEAEALSYSFTVDAANPVLLVKFAVVMEDPGHVGVAQPRFVIRITDQNGDLLEECAEYDVSARPDIPGFQSYQGNMWTPVRWRDWTNVGLDMSRFVGQQVQVQFITYDCTQMGHYGYAYFTAQCIPNRLQLNACTGSQFTLEAPENFESYKWSNGDTTRTATFNTASSNNSQISCTVTSATGCQFPLFAYITTNSGSVQTGNFTDIICEGDTYTKHDFDLPPQKVGTHFYQNVIINPQACSGNQEVNLTLTVVQRYTHIKEAICHGQDYIANGFNIVKPAVGVRRDTIKTGTINGCDTYNVLELTISANLSMPNIIQGEASPCTDDMFTYTFAGAESLTSFEWIIPANAILYKSSRYDQTIQLYFTDATPGTLSLSGENGCGNGTAQLNITPRQTYSIQLNEEVCQGESFNRYNFNLGRQDSVGYFVYAKHLESSLDCDSVVTLALSVLPKPKVHITPINTVLCNPGDEVTLWAMTDSMKICPDFEDEYNALTPTSESDFDITTYPESCQIDAYHGPGGKVVIPNEINGKPVIRIAANAFTSNQITEVVIPPSVSSIQAGAFNNCASLNYVTFNNVHITGTASLFNNCPNVIIRCYQNTPAHLFAALGNEKFELIYGCEAECSDKYYDSQTQSNPADFTALPVANTTGYCQIQSYTGSDTKIVIPDRINGLKPYALLYSFQSSNVEEVVIPPSVVVVGNNFLADCSQLTYVTIPGYTLVTVGAFVNSPNVIIRCRKGSHAHQYAIANNIKFEIICTGNELGGSSAGNSNSNSGGSGGTANDIACGDDYEAWYNTQTPADEADFGTSIPASPNYSLTSYNGTGGKVIIPSNINGKQVTEISNYVFDGANLTEVIIPPTVFHIGVSFRNNNSLTYVTIPKSVTQMVTIGGSYAFENSPNVIIRCYENSQAHHYAQSNNIKFELIKECENFCAFDYDTYYNALTPNAASEFNTTSSFGGLPKNCVIGDGLANAYSGLNSKVIIPGIINGDTVWGLANKSFLSSNVTEVICPPTLKAIGETFHNCPQLTYITINKNTSLAPNAIYNSPNVIIRCFKNSYAHQYAIDNNVKFELLNECSSSGETEVNIYDCDLTYQWSNGSTDGFITVSPTQTTEYSVIVTTQNGCSAEAKQTVLVNTATPTPVNDTICEGDTYSEYGLNETVSGVYPVTIHKDDCDITFDVHLHVNPKYELKVTDTICAGEAYQKHGLDFVLIQPGIFRDTLNFLRSTGCDSTVTLEITVLPEIHTVLRDTICQNRTYTENGFNLPVQSIAGEFSHSFTTTSAGGCDSTVMLTLLVNPVIENIISDEVLKDSAYTRYNFHFPKVTQDTVVTSLLQHAITGCDSTVILNLTVKNPPAGCVKDTVKIAETICLNEFFFFNNKNLNIADEYRDTLTNAAGCDSLVILTLTVNTTDTTRLNASIDEGESYWFGSNELTASGKYQRVLTNAISCDSVIILQLSVIHTPEPEQPTVAIPEGFSPNGDGVNDVFDIRGIEQFPNNKVLIFNRWGNKVFEGKPYQNNWDGRNHEGGNIGNDELPAGTYFYILELGDGSKAQKGFIFLTR